MFESEACAINSANLTSGDILVLYTDGVTDAANLLGEEFGLERLSNLIRSSHALSADGLMNHIVGSVTDFSRDVGFEDDVTILVVKFDFDSM
jgi:serine phosphatase RsbU (regulator of sigma subunit)